MPKGKDDPARRQKMLELITNKTPIAVIAAAMGYKDERSARTMIYRWGYHTLLDGSTCRGPNPPFVSAVYRQGAR